MNVPDVFTREDVVLTEMRSVPENVYVANRVSWGVFRKAHPRDVRGTVFS
jgi:hypothetical protein